MKHLKPKELSNIEQLKKKGKFTEALKITNELESKKGLPLQDQLEIHHLKSSLLFELGYMNKALNYAELAYKESQQLKNKSQMIDVLLTKLAILSKSYKPNETLRTINKTEQLLNTIEQTSPKEFKEKKAYIALYRSGCYLDISELNQSIKYAEDLLTIAKEIKNKTLLMRATKLILFNNYYKGDLGNNFEYNKRYLTLAEELNDKQEIIGALNSFGCFFIEKGDFDKALGHLKRGLSLCDEINSWKKIVILSSLFEVYINMNSLEKAQQCLDRMKQLSDQLEFDPDSTFYRLSKARLLKRKPQKINHLKAKEILKQLTDEESPFSGIYYPALIELCDLCLTELSETNDLKTLDEIQPYITQLKEIAENQQSFWLLVETYSFQAKLKLLTFEFKEAQKILSQALDIAEKYSQTLLAKRISKEQDELVNEKSKWETLRNSNAIMSERIELAHLSDQIMRMLRKRIYLQKSIE